jgi:Carboxypeptidase regulatory-like domain
MLSRCWKQFTFLSLCSLILLSGNQIARACSCMPRPPVLDSYDESDVVVILRALSVEKVKDTDERHYVEGIRSTTMLVEKVFKGNLKVGSEIVFGQGGGADCIWTFDEKSIGEQFLFYVNTPRKYYREGMDPNLWYAGTCGRSNGLRHATEDLLYLENIDKVRGKTRISGSIGGGWKHPELKVDDKKIRIVGAKGEYEVKTDSHGVFEIYDLPPGRYFIEPEIPAGYKINSFTGRSSRRVVGADFYENDLKFGKRVPIDLEPKRHAAVDITFAIDNAVRGKVVDAEGNPMSGACVTLRHAEKKEGGGGGDCTNENGLFEITSVPSGSYIVVMNDDGKPSSREPFRTFYYPNVTERDSATIITIGPGEVIDDLNMVVASVLETITIEGTLRYSDGKPVVDGYVDFDAEKSEKVDGDVIKKTDANGHFSIRILKGIKGELSADDYVYIGEYENCPKLDSLIRKTGKDSLTVKTNVISIQGDKDLFNLELVYPFPGCKKKN